MNDDETPAEKIIEKIVDYFDGVFTNAPESLFTSFAAFAVGIPLMGLIIVFGRARFLYAGLELEFV